MQDVLYGGVASLMRFHIGLSMPFHEAAMLVLVLITICVVVGFLLAATLRRRFY
jgi:hypothetical protein